MYIGFEPKNIIYFKWDDRIRVEVPADRLVSAIAFVADLAQSLPPKPGTAVSLEIPHIPYSYYLVIECGTYPGSIPTFFIGGGTEKRQVSNEALLLAIVRYYNAKIS